MTIPWSILAHTVLLLTTLGILTMSVLSHRYYTSAGVDLERMDDEQVLRTCFRVRWPGNGGIWFGGEAYHRRPSRKPVEVFDPACSAFRVPQHLPEPESLWNRLGFWWIASPKTDPCNNLSRPLLEWGFWCGVPAWLPAVFTAFPSIRRGLRAWLGRPPLKG